MPMTRRAAQMLLGLAGPLLAFASYGDEVPARPKIAAPQSAIEKRMIERHPGDLDVGTWEPTDDFKACTAGTVYSNGTWNRASMERVNAESLDCILGTPYGERLGISVT